MTAESTRHTRETGGSKGVREDWGFRECQWKQGVRETGGQRRLGRHGKQGVQGDQGGSKYFWDLRVVLEEAEAATANNPRASALYQPLCGPESLLVPSIR